MTGIELVQGRGDSSPAPQCAAALKAAAYRRGLLLLTCGTSGNVVRLMMPLTVPYELLDEGLSILDASLAEVA